MLEEITYDGNVYLLSNERPKTNDKVLTDEYGVWTYHEGTAPIPYWCNPNTCKKIISINGIEVN